MARLRAGLLGKLAQFKLAVAKANAKTVNPG
jgi:hypothetical protein